MCLNRYRFNLDNSIIQEGRALRAHGAGGTAQANVLQGNDRSGMMAAGSVVGHGGRRESREAVHLNRNKHSSGSREAVHYVEQDSSGGFIRRTDRRCSQFWEDELADGDA